VLKAFKCAAPCADAETVSQPGLDETALTELSASSYTRSIV
jgi:hypothetical protein